MRIGILFFLGIGLNFCVAQTDFTKEIIGTWKLVVAEADESIYKKRDPLINKDTVLEFKNEETIIITVEEFQLEATYTLKETILTIGIREFVLLKITKDKLLLTDKNDDLSIQHTYKKIKKNE